MAFAIPCDTDESQKTLITNAHNKLCFKIPQTSKQKWLLIVVSCSSVLIYNNIQVPRYKALLVLPYFIPIATAVRQDELNSALRCNPRVYHVDSIFTEWIPVCALWEVHQNLRPEGPSNGALLKGLT